MCKKRNSKAMYIDKRRIRVDSCISKLLICINFPGNVKTRGCCCGHGKYNMSIVVENIETPGVIYDIISGKLIHRKKRFYVKDKDGFYFIPETLEK